ncbi:MULTISPECIES: carbohydrate ABC transporter permease [Clostridium]|jgi:carbohydrate ABC transporter membrane protein 1, CUT1 family (TC 3.A.1.1.-)|uniref:Sugar ABC transporter permease n=3 Tax=Clostridium beijerinckii TaxID=1520 RepID=A0AAE2RUS2_CLOBE|nr:MULTISPECIES: sugar ABC transporter permease [Clostridium]ABR34518.1 binding-protein-dependent transport systems inner membrane component [Clostridium beijerinckii NCIMB 8052]AIU01948.1 binding-protein-dependent transport systems inner membrane component [Clostridium beijerinckii ATCC 35702]AVK51327.1 arabinose transporter permease [Clostridium sp. MF28]MBF7810856.1 sugar ABC transporter permease [Clostridium beijerinckii]MDG5854610.1 sugar ABC transporter permease [Clostridium beijerinckii
MVKRFIYNKKAAPYVFILPFILVFLLFFISPMVNTVIMSFENVLPGSRKFVGFENYTKLLGDKVFLVALWNSFKYMIWTLILLIPIPMILACIIDSKLMVGKEFFKSALYLPALTSVAVAGIIFRFAFGEQSTSLMNQVVALFGMDPFKWLKNGTTGFIVLLVLACWRWTGVNMLYFLSGLKNIPAELYESADIDGANTLQKFRYITIPQLKPTTIYVLTISIYAGLAMFIESYMVFNGNNSPNNIGLTIVGYLYRQGIEKNAMGYASAVGLVLFIIGMAINLVQLKLNGTFKKGD